jgi:hypothetical protein
LALTTQSTLGRIGDCAVRPIPSKETRQAGDACPLCFAEGLKRRILDPKYIAQGWCGGRPANAVLEYPLRLPVGKNALVPEARGGAVRVNTGFETCDTRNQFNAILANSILRGTPRCENIIIFAHTKYLWNCYRINVHMLCANWGTARGRKQ